MDIDIFDRARRALHELGPLTDDELVDAVGLDPDDPDDHDAVDELLDGATEEGIWTLGTDRYLLAEHVLEGNRFTRRVSAEEVAEGRLQMDADLVALTWTSEGWDVEREFDDEDGEWLTGPDGWLRTVEPGSLTVFSWRDRELQVEPVTTAPDAGEVPQLIRSAFDATVGRFGTTIDHDLYGQVATMPGRPFAEVRPPWTELLAAAGLERRGMDVAPIGFDWDQLEAAHRDDHAATLAARHGLSRVQGHLLADLERGASERTTAALRDRDVVRAYVDDDLEGPYAFVAVPFAAEIAAVGLADDDPPAGAHLVAARVAELSGDVAGLEAGVAAALAADAELDPALWDAAFLALWRGHAREAIDLGRRAGAARDDALAARLRRFVELPAGVSRNAPCPCGSGRKTKQCCIDSLRHPLTHRAHWLYDKLSEAIDRAPYGRSVLDVAADLLGAPDPIQPGVAMAFLHESFWSLALYDGGLALDVVERYGELLPDDERSLAESWTSLRHRFLKLDDVLPGTGLRFEDLHTGERLQVLARIEPGSWRLGEAALALVAPVGDEWVLLGEPVLIPESVHEEVLAALGSDEPRAVARVCMRWQVGAELLLAEERRAERIRFVLPGVDLDDVDVDDEDEVAALIAATHGPVPGEDVSEDLHLALHGVVACRLIADEPPGIWDEAQRLLRRGHSRDEVLHHLMYEAGEELRTRLL